MRSGSGIGIDVPKQTIGDADKRLIFPGIAAHGTLGHGGRVVF
jgi:hypothetical protein